MHHFADDGAGADERHLHHDIVKADWFHARQTGHLRAAFHLEHADGVGLLERREDGGVVGRKLREIDFGAQLEALFEHRHHAETKQVDFDDAEIGAILFIPLDDDAPGHAGGLQRHHGIECALADDHAAGVLAEVTRQVLRHAVELAKLAHARVVEVEAGFAELALGGVLWIFEFPGPRQAAELFDGSDFEAQRLADLARGGAPAVGDDVGRHGGAVRSEALVDILDDLFAFVAAGEIEIDIRPLAALFAEEAFEEKVHADGVDGGDFERVADGAIGGAAAALGEDVVLFAEAHDVPDDEEVTGEMELFNEREFALDLLAGALVIGPVAAARALAGESAQQAHLGLAFGDGVAGELVAEVGEGELQTRGDFARVGNGFGEVGEEAGHFGGRLDVALAVRVQEAGRGGLIEGLFLAVAMALEFGAESMLAEDIEEAIIGVCGEADQPAREFGEFVQGGCALALGGAQFHAGDQAAEVAVTFAGGSQQGVGAAVGAGDFAADVGAHAGLLGSHVETGRAVDAVTVDERHGGHVEIGACAGQVFRHAGAFEEAEGGACVEFDIGVSHYELPVPSMWGRLTTCAAVVYRLG